MGRYLRRSTRAGAGEVTVVEVVAAPQCPVLGVRTRSRALALQRHYHQQQLGPSSPLRDTTGDTASYLQLRSRRLEKTHGVPGGGCNSPRKCKGAAGPTRARGASCCGQLGEEEEKERERVDMHGPFFEWGPAPTAREVRRMVAKAYAIMRWEPDDERAGQGEKEEDEQGGERQHEEEEEEESVQASCGDDGLQLELVESRGERFSRETTPCSLIIRSDDMRTPPGSTNRRRSAARGKRLVAKDNDGASLPVPGDGYDEVLGMTATTTTTTREMEEFFTGAEQHQQREFIDKYNFDVVNEFPLPGRYEWEKLVGGGGSGSW